MTNYPQWHDEENTFYRTMQLMFGQCDANLALSLEQLFLVTSDSAVEDFAQRGLTWQYLNKYDVAILLSRASFHVNRMPIANETLFIETREEPPEGIQLYRSYDIFEYKDEKKGELLVSGRSSWLAVNPATRRIIPAKQFTLREAPTRKKEFIGIPCGKITEEQYLYSQDRKVYFSDIDGNGHVNNSRYGAFVRDVLPPEYRNRPFKDIRINYSKEAVLDDVITMNLSADESGNKLCIIGKVGDSNCFECELYY